MNKILFEKRSPPVNIRGAWHRARPLTDGGCTNNKRV